MAYYYLISSLPMLKSDGDMPFSYEQFLQTCRGALNDTTYMLLENLTLSSNEGPCVSEWSQFYTMFKEELTFQRNIRLGNKVSPPSDRDESISKIISTAMNHKNPLIAEEMLLALQFEKLDALIGLHYFDEYALIGYALKLKLLERKTVFNKQEGKTEFSNIVGKLEQQILNMEQE